MATVRRYGPSMVAPEVTPAPALGRASQQVFETIEAGFNKVNQFIRPAVEQIQTAKGEQEALGALEDSGPDFQPVLKEGAVAPGAGDAPGAGAAPDADPHAGHDHGSPVQPGPTRAAAAAKPAKRGNVAKVYSKGVTSAAVSTFEALETAWGRPLNVISGYRDSGHNAKVGGAKGSQHIHGNAFDVDVSDLSIEERQALIMEAGAAGFKGVGVYDNSLHFDVAGKRAWGPDYKSGSIPEWAKGALAGIRDAGNGMADYELKNVNSKSFEPRLPFTVRDAAFNASADRVLSARASEAMETGLMLAQQKANGDLGVLRSEMEKVRNDIMGSLPKEMPGLATDLEATFTRGLATAERQAIVLKEKQMIAANTEAMKSQAAAVQAEVERIALTGGGSAAISAALAGGQDALAAYGPREGFTINGKEYGPDPRRAGLMTPAEIATGVSGLAQSSHKIMLEAEFMKSAAPGQFVEEFRKQVFAGKSPLGVGESLALLSEFQGRANAAESQRRTAANAERARLEKEYQDRINPYVEMNEAGIPVAVPPAERARIVADLAPFPDLQREAETAFAVADAAVATHGMRGDEIVAYSERIKADIAAAAAAGEIDLEAVGVVQSLEDRVKKAQDAVTAEMIGLPMIEQLAMDGATADDVNWDELRAKAAGKPEVLAQIAVTEAFYRDIESLEGMSAQDRDDLLAEARQRQAELAAMGTDYGAAALQTDRVLSKLTDWSAKRKDLAANDALAFARAAGVAMPALDGAQSMGDVGSVLAQRIALLAPLTASEGVKHPVPLSQREIDAISEIYRGSSRSQQTTFLAAISDLGQEQAQAIFGKIGQTEPTLFAAGVVYAGGNQKAASVILRGSVDAKVSGGTPAEISGARSAALGDLLTADLVDAASLPAIDAAALAYARGAALADGGRDITQSDLETGFNVAMGAQEDGTGGVQYTSMGATVLPAGWDADRFDSLVDSWVDADLIEIAGGTVQDASGRPFDAASLRRTVEVLRVDPTNPNVLIPMDEEGGVFMVDQGGTLAMLTFDLGELK